MARSLQLMRFWLITTNASLSPITCASVSSCVIQLCSLFDYSSYKGMSSQFGGGNTPAREWRQVKPRSEQAGRGMHVTRLHGHVAEIKLSAALCAAPARLSCRKHGTRARECGGKGFDVCWLPLAVTLKRLHQTKLQHPHLINLHPDLHTTDLVKTD